MEVQVWLCRIAENSFLLERDREVPKKQQTDYFAPAFIFHAFYEARKTDSPKQADLLPLYFSVGEQYNVFLCPK